MGGGSIAGGVVLLAYLFASAFCGKARRLSLAKADKRTWTAIALVLLLLAAEKAVHLEAFLTNVFGRIAEGGGWYGSRHGVQLDAIAALTMIGVTIAVATIWLLRRAAGTARIAAVATVLLVAFVAVRAVSLHQLDRAFAIALGPLRISNVVELAALCVIGGAAGWRGVVHADLAVDK